MAQDPRQLSRLIPGGTPTIVPPEPSLAEVYESGKSSGLGSVFKSYDQARAGWRAKLGQMLQNLTRAQQTSKDPRIAWRKYTRAGNALTYIGGNGYPELEFFNEIALSTRTALLQGLSDYVQISVPASLSESTLRVVLTPLPTQEACSSPPLCFQATRRTGPYTFLFTLRVTDEDVVLHESYDPDNPVAPGVQLGSVYLELV